MTMLVGAELAARARLALGVPMQATLGAYLLDASDPTAGAAFVVDGVADNGAGGAHASALGAVMELAAYLALLPSLDEGEHAVTHAVATQLIAVAPLGATVSVHGHLDRRTRRTAFLTAEATVDDTVVARAQLTKTVVPFAP